MAFTISQSFDPRIGTMQKIFAVIYVLITLVALSLAFYVRSEGQDGYLQFFMAALFAIMAIKSFYIANRVKNLLTNGKYFSAKVDSVEPVRGITVIKGVVDIPDYGLIYIESRLAGETPARELKRYLEEHKQDHLPALVVAANTKHPRGMFTIKCKNGHLDKSSAVLKTEEELAAEAKATDAASDAATPKTETTATGFKVPAEQKMNAEAQAAATEPKADAASATATTDTAAETSTASIAADAVDSTAAEDATTESKSESK